MCDFQKIYFRFIITENKKCLVLFLAHREIIESLPTGERWGAPSWPVAPAGGLADGVEHVGLLAVPCQAREDQYCGAGRGFWVGPTGVIVYPVQRNLTAITCTDQLTEGRGERTEAERLKRPESCRCVVPPVRETYWETRLTCGTWRGVWIWGRNRPGFGSGPPSTTAWDWSARTPQDSACGGMHWTPHYKPELESEQETQETCQENQYNCYCVYLHTTISIFKTFQS